MNRVNRRKRESERASSPHLSTVVCVCVCLLLGCAPKRLQSSQTPGHQPGSPQVHAATAGRMEQIVTTSVCFLMVSRQDRSGFEGDYSVFLGGRKSGLDRGKARTYGDSESSMLGRPTREAAPKKVTRATARSRKLETPGWRL